MAVNETIHENIYLKGLEWLQKKGTNENQYYMIELLNDEGEILGRTCGEPPPVGSGRWAPIQITDFNFNPSTSMSNSTQQIIGSGVKFSEVNYENTLINVDQVNIGFPIASYYRVWFLTLVPGTDLNTTLPADSYMKDSSTGSLFTKKLNREQTVNTGNQFNFSEITLTVNLIVNN